MTIFFFKKGETLPIWSARSFVCEIIKTWILKIHTTKACEGVGAGLLVVENHLEEKKLYVCVFPDIIIKFDLRPSCAAWATCWPATCARASYSQGSDFVIIVTSVSDPDPFGSVSLGRIHLRNRWSGSG